jgi:hypothetical protein
MEPPKLSVDVVDGQLVVTVTLPRSTSMAMAKAAAEKDAP